MTLGKRRTRGRGDVLSIDLLDDSTEWTAPTASASSSQSKIVSTQSASKQPNSSLSNKKDILSDPRLAIFMEKARYEAFVDPYRGIFPCFPLPVAHNTNNGSHCFSQDSVQNNPSETISTLRPGQDVWVYTRQPAVILSVDDDQKHAIVKWSTRQSHERIVMGKISPMAENANTIRGRNPSNCDVSADDALRREVDIKSEKLSPWMECRNVLNDTSTWKYTFPGGLDVDCLHAKDDDADKSTATKDILVTCNCPSVNTWAQEEWDALEKERLASMKKKRIKSGKRMRQKESEVVIVDGSGDEEENDSEKNLIVTGVVPLKNRIVCGRRDDHDECPCDYNPVCAFGILSYSLCSRRL